MQTYLSEYDKIDKVRGQWKAAKPDLDTFPMETIGRILRIESLVNLKMRQVLARYQIERGGLDVLATLRRLGHPYETTPTQLYKTLVLTSGAITHRIDSLERADLVERLADPEDRRSMLIRLTKKGLALIDLAIKEYMAVEAEIISHLTEAEQKNLASLLKNILIKMEIESD